MRQPARHDNQHHCGVGRTAHGQFYGPAPGWKYDDRVPIRGVPMPSMLEQIEAINRERKGRS